MPRYSYSNPARRLAATEQPAPVQIDRTLERPSAERAARVSRPSAAKTVESVPRVSAPRKPKSDA